MPVFCAALSGVSRAVSQIAPADAPLLVTQNANQLARGIHPVRSSHCAEPALRFFFEVS